MFGTEALAKGLSPDARAMIIEYRASGESEKRYVADALNEIAGNGDGSETDEFLVVCANAIVDAARGFAQRIEEGPGS